jgi:hypothetical protein
LRAYLQAAWNYEPKVHVLTFYKFFKGYKT